MASDKLAEIRAKLAAMDNKADSRGSGNSDNTIYPFWNIQEGDTATLRFLPDGDPENTFFWVERQIIKLEFPGVVGDANRKVTLQVPCGEMYGDPCPVLTEIRPWFQNKETEDLARKYWKKRSYIFQGFVTEDPLKEENPPENPIRRFIIGPQIFNIIKGALMDPDMENIPTEYVDGTDFRLTKSSKGQYADYSTSKWARKERSLTEIELAAIDQHGLFDLKSFLPTRPTADHYRAIHELFEASLNGELYDPTRWADFYKPYGLDTGTRPQSTSAPAQSAPAQPKVTETVSVQDHSDIPFETETVAEKPAPPANGKKDAADILAMIRERKQ